MLQKRIVMTTEEAAAAIRRIENLRRAIKEIEERRDARIDELKTDAAAEITMFMRGVTMCELAVERFARKNRDGLTEGGKRKSASLLGWTIRWHLTSKVVFVGGKIGMKQALEFVLKQTKKYGKFVTYKPQLNREAMHEDPKLAKTIPSVEGVIEREGFAILLLGGTEQLRRDPFSKKLKFEPTKKRVE